MEHVTFQPHHIPLDPILIYNRTKTIRVKRDNVNYNNPAKGYKIKLNQISKFLGIVAQQYLNECTFAFMFFF